MLDFQLFSNPLCPLLLPHNFYNSHNIVNFLNLFVMWIAIVEDLRVFCAHQITVLDQFLRLLNVVVHAIQISPHDNVFCKKNSKFHFLNIFLTIRTFEKNHELQKGSPIFMDKITISIKSHVMKFSINRDLIFRNSFEHHQRVHCEHHYNKAHMKCAINAEGR